MMMRRRGTGVLAMVPACLLAGFVAVVAVVAAAAPLTGDRTYDLLFRGGTLDEIARNAELVYRRQVTNALQPRAAARDTGDVALSFRTGDRIMALLEFHQDGKHKPLGRFPAGVGNPIIMYFHETVVRDMADAAGGSPFYIRNRIKEALVAPSQIKAAQATFAGRTIPTQTVLIRPFTGDPNRTRMQRFADLGLRVTMSDAVPGWYLRMEALADGGDLYRSVMTFEGLESAE